MKYQHEATILDNEIASIPKLNELITTATYRTISAIDDLSEQIPASITIGLSLEEKRKSEIWFETFLLTSTLFLKSFLTTHTSIIHIHNLGNDKKLSPKPEGNNENTNMLFGADAMSLAREQIEKVFHITLLCEEPIKWTEIYIKDEWKHWYEYKLHLKHENQLLPNFVQYYNTTFLEELKSKKNQHNISDKEQETVDFMFNNPASKKLPQHLEPFRIKQFPNPGKIKDIVKNYSAKQCLERWHWEYKYFSGFSHVGMSKMNFLFLSDRRFKSKLDQSVKEKVYNDKIFLPSLWVSYTATANAITEVFTILQAYAPNNIEIIVALIELWETLEKKTLIAKAIWNIRAKDFFPTV